MNAFVLEQQIQPDVLAAARGDSQAYGRLVDACRNAVCSIALAVTRDVASSEDIAQEVFLAGWRNLPRLNNPASFLPYLRQTARNLAHSQLRSPERQRAVRDQADLLIGSVVDPAPGHAERLIESEDERALADVIDALDDEAREVITIFYREGQSVQQVAGLLGLQEATVRKRLSRARAKIRADLLTRFADAARSSAPGAAFTAFVLSALSAASPPVAAAAAMTATGGASAGLLSKLAAALGGAMIGVGFGVSAVVLGLRRQFARARDEQERRDLRRLRLAAIVLVVLTASLLGPNPWIRDWLLPSVAYAILIAGLALLYLYLLPRITRRSRAAELRDDPDAARRHRRERIMGWLGWIAGAVSGGLGLYFGLVKTGLMP